MSNDKKVVTLRMSQEEYEKLEKIAVYYGNSSVNGGAKRMIANHLAALDELKTVKAELRLKTTKLNDLRRFISQKNEIDRLIAEFVAGES